MSDVFPIKALNDLVNDYCYLYLTPTDYTAAAEQKRDKDECTIAYYDSNGQLIVKTLESTNRDKVLKCHEEANGCLTLFGSCRGMFFEAIFVNRDISTWDVGGVTDMYVMFALSGVSQFPRWYRE